MRTQGYSLDSDSSMNLSQKFCIWGSEEDSFRFYFGGERQSSTRKNKCDCVGGTNTSLNPSYDHHNYQMRKLITNSSSVRSVILTRRRLGIAASASSSKSSFSLLSTSTTSSSLQHLLFVSSTPYHSGDYTSIYHRNNNRGLNFSSRNYSTLPHNSHEVQALIDKHAAKSQTSASLMTLMKTGRGELLEKIFNYEHIIEHTAPSRVLTVHSQNMPKSSTSPLAMVRCYPAKSLRWPAPEPSYRSSRVRLTLTNVKHDVNSPATFLRWVCPRRCLVDHSTVPGRLLI